MNDKTFFHIGIFFLILGAGAFVMVIKPWEKMNQDSDIFFEKNTTATTSEIIVLDIPQNSSSPEISEKIRPQNTAENFFIQQNFLEAIAIAQEDHKKNPQDTRSLEILIDSHIALSDYFQAEEYITKLLLLRNTPQNQVKKIEILILSGKKDAAKKSIHLLPKSEEKEFYLLLVSLLEERYDDTKKHATTLVTSNSQYKETAQEFLNIFDNYKSFRDGSPHYLRTMMANLLNILDYHTLTIQFIKPTLEEYPDYRDAWIIMGNSYLSLKKFNLAERFFETALSLDPAHPKTPYFLAITLAEKGQYNEAIEQFKNALKNQYTPESKVQRYIAETYLRQKNYEKSVEYFQEVIADDERVEFQDYAYAITLSIEHLKSPDLALKTATKLNKKFPENSRSLPFLAWALLETGSLDQARATLIKSIEKNPNQGENFLFMGQLYEKENRNQEAFDAYKKGYQIQKGSAISRECAQKYNALKTRLSE